MGGEALGSLPRRSRKQRLSRRLFHQEGGGANDLSTSQVPTCSKMDGVQERKAVEKGGAVCAKLVIDSLVNLPVSALTASEQVAGVRVFAHLWTSDLQSSQGHSRKLGQTDIADIECLAPRASGPGAASSTHLSATPCGRGPPEQQMRALEVVVETGRHLPKMDTIGKCDGFCEIMWHDSVKTTRVEKNTYSPDWRDRFEFLFTGDLTGDLVLTLKDWDRFSSPDVIGQATISPTEIEEMARASSTGRAFQVLTAQGKPVIGHDKSPCVIEVKIALRPVGADSKQIPIPQPSPAPAPQDAVDVDCQSLEELSAATASVELRWGTMIQAHFEAGLHQEQEQILVFSTVGVDAKGNDLIVLGTACLPTTSLRLHPDLISMTLQVYDEGKHAIRAASGECAFAVLPSCRHSMCSSSSLRREALARSLALTCLLMLPARRSHPAQACGQRGRIRTSA